MNLVFKDEALTLDENGFYATVLDLARQKFLEIKPKGEAPDAGIAVRVLRDLVRPLRAAGPQLPPEPRVGDIVDTDALKGLTEHAPDERARPSSRVMKIQTTLRGITTEVDPTVANRFIIDGRPHLVPALLGSAILAGISILILVVGSPAAGLLLPAAALGSIAVIQVVIAWAFPSVLFGQWKGDSYPRKTNGTPSAPSSLTLPDQAVCPRTSPCGGVGWSSGQPSAWGRTWQRR